MTPAEILAALDAAATILGFIERQLAAARERGELTPEQEAQFDARIAEVTARPHWQK